MSAETYVARLFVSAETYVARLFVSAETYVARLFVSAETYVARLFVSAETYARAKDEIRNVLQISIKTEHEEQTCNGNIVMTI